MKSLSVAIAALASLLASSTEARLSSREIDPSLTGSGIEMIRGPHRILRDPAVRANGKVLVTLGGTGSTPSGLDFIQRLAASLGFRVLALDYTNTISTVTCETAVDPICYDDFRREIVEGAQVSDRVDVDVANSIENRVAALVKFLGWNKTGAFDWSRVVLVGHSQGAGHAAYLAKRHSAAKVIMIAGPVDKSSSGLGPWLSRPGLTPPDRFFAFMNVNDPFDTPRMIDVVRALFFDPLAPIAVIDRTPPIDSRERIWLTDARTPDPHSAVIRAEFEDVWKALLTR